MSKSNKKTNCVPAHLPCIVLLDEDDIKDAINFELHPEGVLFTDIPAEGLKLTAEHLPVMRIVMAHLSRLELQSS